MSDLPICLKIKLYVEDGYSKYSALKVSSANLGDMNCQLHNKEMNISVGSQALSLAMVFARGHGLGKIIAFAATSEYHNEWVAILEGGEVSYE